MREEFKYDLIDNAVSFICSKWLLDRTPYIFNDDRIKYIQWKELLAEKLQIDSKSIVFTGSSSCGFSLNPNKNYSEFNEDSDIDIAIVSGYHFDVAWKHLRNLGTKRFDLNSVQKNSLKEHVNRLIYWGTIATDKILVILPFGKEWALHLLDMRKIEPINNRPINIRIYKDYESLRAYHLNNLTNLRTQLYENE